MFCFLRTFALIFHFRLCSFCWRGAQEYFLPQGAGYPSYATDRNPKNTSELASLSPHCSPGILRLIFDSDFYFRVVKSEGEQDISHW